jgi:PTS system mannose-specific IIC component
MWLDFSAFIWVTLKVSLCGAFCALDRTAFLQMMSSRPLVAATFAGALAGNWEIGLLLGAALELYFLSEIPVGTIIPTDDTLLALAAGGAGAALSNLPQSQGQSSGTLALVVLLTILPWSAFTRRVDSWVRRKNAQLVDEVETALLAGPNLTRAQSSALNYHLYGLFNFYGASAFALGLMVMSSLLLAPLLLFFVPTWIQPLTDRLLFLFPVFGIAGLLSNMNQKRHLAVFAGVAASLLVLF